MAFKILLHTFRMIFGNLGQALKVSVGPYLILILGYAVSLAALFMMGDSTVRMMPLITIMVSVLLPLSLFVAAWVAVSWHRFILLEEGAGLLPTVKGKPIWPYAGRLTLLGLLIAIIAISLVFLVGIISAVLPFLAIPLFVVVVVILGFVGLKIAVSLVGTALGKTMQVGEVWKATDRINNTIFGLVFLMVIINVVPGLIIAGIAAYIPIIGFVLDVALSWLTMMLGISILTTIYGHVIEGRPLVS